MKVFRCYHHGVIIKNSFFKNFERKMTSPFEFNLKQ